MAYIGAEPLIGQNREVDDISSSFNGSTTAFTLQVNSLNTSPESANNILVSVGGIIQNPGTDYTINASTITFTTAPASGLSFMGLILGAGINTATVADGAITTAKLGSDSVNADKLANTAVTAGSYTTADITVDAQGRITAAASGSISNAEIANNAVTTAKIADSTGSSDGVTTAKLATDAVTAAKLADNAVVNASVDASAAIAGTKISPDFGSQNIVTTGGLTVDTTTLKVDASNNRVGVGTASPDETLHISGNSSGAISAKIENTYSSDANRFAILELKSGVGSIRFHDQGDTIEGEIKYDTTTNSMRFATNGNSERLRIDSSGNLGIGTTSPSQHLHVAANVNSDEKILVVNSNTGSSARSSVTLQSDSSTLQLYATSAAYSGVSSWGDSGVLSTGSGTSGGLIFNTQASSSAIKFQTQTNERVRIDSVGKIIAGATSTSDTSEMLLIASAGTGDHCGIGIKTNNNVHDGYLAFHDSDATFRGQVRYDHSVDAMFFSTSGNTERMRIDNAGRVSIGTTANNAHFQVYVNAASRVPVDVNDTNNTSTLTHRIRFLTGGTEVGRIRSSNSATSYDTSASDITLKKNFEDWTENTLDLFKNINPQKFHFIQEEDTAEKSKGFIAQEMVDSFPEAYTKEDKKDSKYYFNPSGMVVYLMKAIQELEAKVAALEAA